MYVFNNTWYVLLLLVVIEEVCAWRYVCVFLCILYVQLLLYSLFDPVFQDLYSLLGTVYSILDTVMAAITVYSCVFPIPYMHSYSLFPTGSHIPSRY